MHTQSAKNTKKIRKKWLSVLRNCPIAFGLHCILAHQDEKMKWKHQQQRHQRENIIMWTSLCVCVCAQSERMHFWHIIICNVKCCLRSRTMFKIKYKQKLCTLFSVPHCCYILFYEVCVRSYTISRVNVLLLLLQPWRVGLFICAYALAVLCAKCICNEMKCLRLHIKLQCIYILTI